MNSLVIVYIPHTVEYSPAVQFSSLEYVTVSASEMDTPEEERLGDGKLNGTTAAGKMLENSTPDTLMQHILRDDLQLLNGTGKSNRKEAPFLHVEPQDTLLGYDQPVFDCEVNPTKYATISSEVILEESSSSSSSLDEGIGLSNTEDSSDDQTCAKAVPVALATKPAQTAATSTGALRKQKKEKAKHYHCEICDDRFTMKKHLREHQGSKHPGQNCNKCAICEKTFKLRSNLRQHLRIHTGERPFRCDICGKTFVQGSALTVHRELHKEQRDYQCPVCQKAFKSKFAFKKHEKVHTGLRPFKCDECGKSFTQSCNLKAHQKLHTGNHAYQCETCCKSFRFKSHYQDHLMTHTKDKKYCCAQCGRTFAYKNSFQRHTLIHRDEAQHQCGECGKQFSKLSHLTFHHKAHGCVRLDARLHGPGTRNLPSDTGSCSWEGNDSRKETIHRRVRPALGTDAESVREKGCCRYKCVICSKSFREERELRTHFKLHEADDCPFQCGMCGILNLNQT
uniref:C2H2-type domain-containing protein n=1 Tax=Anopheles farauti TaxID=69004 RepID=A0A182Q438_9DIPT